MRLVTLTWAARLMPKLGLALLVGVVVACAHQTDKEYLADPSLEPAPKGNFDEVFLPPDSRLPRFREVYLEPTEVALSDYWLKDRRSDYTARDLERIKEDYGRLMDEALTRGFNERTEVEFVDNPEDADVIFRPKLRELNIYAPDLLGEPTRLYSREAGNATFDLTLLDATTGEVLGQFIDHRETRSLQEIEQTNRATNYRHFRRLMERWTHNLTDYLLIGGNVPSND